MIMAESSSDPESACDSQSATAPELKREFDRESAPELDVEPASAAAPRSIVIAPGRVTPAYLRPDAAEASMDPTWSQHRGLILATLFSVTGALGLPLLWRSGRFGRVERWFWAFTVTAYTIALIVGAVYLIRYTAGEMVSPPIPN